MEEKTKEQIARDRKAESPVVITEGTLFPMSLIISFLGGVLWISYVSYTANANASALSQMKDQIQAKDQAIIKELREMNTRLSRIEGKLNGLRRNR